MSSWAEGALSSDGFDTQVAGVHSYATVESSTASAEVVSAPVAATLFVPAAGEDTLRLRMTISELRDKVETKVCAQ
jgi:hypothetical protein